MTDDLPFGNTQAAWTQDRHFEIHSSYVPFKQTVKWAYSPTSGLGGFLLSWPDSSEHAWGYCQRLGKIIYTVASPVVVSLTIIATFI